MPTSNMEPMFELFYFETGQYLRQLEQLIINGEKSNHFSDSAIDEVFRIMHNIKSSSAMMHLTNISSLAHAMEDLFFFLREEKPENVDFSTLSDLILNGVDFIKVELEKVKNGDPADGDNTGLIGNIKNYLNELKQKNSALDNIKAVVYFEEGCEMENIRAFNIVHQLKEIAEIIRYIPEDIMENDQSAEVIKKQGFQIIIKTHRPIKEIQNIILGTAFVRDFEIVVPEKGDEVNEVIPLGPNQSIEKISLPPQR